MPKPTAATSSADGGARLVHGLDDRRHQARLVEAESLPPNPMAHGQIGVDDAREQLGATEVDADDAARSRTGPPPSGLPPYPPPMADEKPEYKVYRSRPRLLRRRVSGAGAAQSRDRAAERRTRPTRRPSRPRRPARAACGCLRCAARPRLPGAPEALTWPGRQVARDRPVRLGRALRRPVHRLGADPARRARRQGRPPARCRPLPAHRREHDPRARLRRAHGGPRRARLRRPEPVGLDHAAADRRRRQRVALDPARHGRPRSPATAPTRSTRPTRSAAPHSPPRPSRSSSGSRSTTSSR